MSLDQLLGLSNATTDWRARVKEGAYKSPLGVRIPYDFVELSRSTTKRTRTWEFHGIDDGFVQDNGHGPRTYPLRCIFNGPNHDKIATSFEQSLLERGPGELEHPLYGTFRAIPIGEIARRNDLVAAANESIVEVTFSTTLADVYPSVAGFPISEILAAIDGFDLAAALAFADYTDLSSVAAAVNFKSALRDGLGAIRNAFDGLAGMTSDARRSIQDNEDLLNDAVDTLVGSPVLLAQQVLNFVAAPGRVLDGLASRIDGYGRMVDRLIAEFTSDDEDETVETKSIVDRVNRARLGDLLALGAVANLARAAEESASNRSEGTKAAQAILDRLSQVVTWREDLFGTLGALDDGAAYQAALDAAARAAGYLADRAFALLPERVLVLDRDRTIIDVAAELYGSVDDDTLNTLITTNDLSGDEILELPRGRAIVYYSNVA